MKKKNTEQHKIGDGPFHEVTRCCDEREAVMEWTLNLHCPMSDGDGFRVGVDESETVAFSHLVYAPKPNEDWEEHYLCQTEDFESAAEFFEQCAQLCRLSKKQIEARRQSE